MNRIYSLALIIPLIINIFLPLVMLDSPARAYPEPGDYDQYTWLTIHIDSPGCTSAWPVFTTDREYSPASYIIYHPECDETGHAGLAISFAKPVKVTGLQAVVFSPDSHTTYEIPGAWSFGLTPTTP